MEPADVLGLHCALISILIGVLTGVRGAVLSYTGAGVVGQRAVVGQCDVLLLPLLVQRAATSLPQDALWKPIRASAGP